MQCFLKLSGVAESPIVLHKTQLSHIHSTLAESLSVEQSTVLREIYIYHRLYQHEIIRDL
jgi:hypothetical protein